MERSLKFSGHEVSPDEEEGQEGSVGATRCVLTRPHSSRTAGSSSIHCGALPSFPPPCPSSHLSARRLGHFVCHC